MFDRHVITRRLITVLLALAVTRCALADDPPPASAARSIGAIVEDYVALGLSSNLALANQTLELEKSQAALAAARARFFPELSFNARYTRADGGRQIVIPVGQLLNPAYQTLNDLLIASGGTARFAPLTDQSIPLQLPREQDTRITLRQPLYAPAINAQVAAARASVSAADYARQAYQRSLRRDITLAYLEWLKARRATEIVTSSEALLAENLRVNQSLYDHGKSTRDTVLRAQAEWLGVEQQQREARNGADQARSYLNFLLNRPLDTVLEAAESAGESMPEAARVGDTAAARPDLLALEQAQLAAIAELNAARAARKPSLALGVDAGTEGVDYGIGRNYNFVTGSLVLSWTLFDAGARAAAVSQARLAAAQYANRHEQLAAQIGLEQQQALDNRNSAGDSLVTANARAEAARAAFKIASRRRDTGMASQLEFFDARNELASAELGRNLAGYTLLQRQAEYAYARGDSQ